MMILNLLFIMLSNILERKRISSFALHLSVTYRITACTPIRESATARYMAIKVNIRVSSLPSALFMISLEKSAVAVPKTAKALHPK